MWCVGQTPVADARRYCRLRVLRFYVYGVCIKGAVRETEGERTLA